MARSSADLVAALAADPKHGAVVCDIDGTLAPIAPTPELARVLPEALIQLERLAGIYALVACVTGRPAAQARSMVPVESVAISGNHGLEVMLGDEVTVVAQAAKYAEPIHQALLAVENDGLLPEMGCRIEDKGITFSVHYRGSPRPDHALRYLETQITPKLDRAGLSWSFGRMVLEVRPPVPIDKGSAVRRLRGRRRIERAALHRRRPHRPGRLPRGHDQDRGAITGVTAGADRGGRRLRGRPAERGRAPRPALSGRCVISAASSVEPKCGCSRRRPPRPSRGGHS